MDIAQGIGIGMVLGMSSYVSARRGKSWRPCSASNCGISMRRRQPGRRHCNDISISAS